MPCYITGSAEGDARLAASEANEEATKLARILCIVGRWADINGRTASMPQVFRDWWQAHKKIDRQREARERAAQRRKELQVSGMSKLTEQEREALNLDSLRIRS